MWKKMTACVYGGSISLAMVTAVVADDAVTPQHDGFYGTLGAAGAATDILRVVCPTVSPPVTSFAAAVRDMMPAKSPLMRVQVEKASPFVPGPIKVDPGSDAYPGDGNAVFSAFSSVPGGAGVYRIRVSKGGIATQAETYELDYHCENGTVNHPAPLPTYIQDQ